MIIQGFTPTNHRLIEPNTAASPPTPTEMPTAVRPGFDLADPLERSVKKLDRHLERALDGSTGQAKGLRYEMWAQQLQQCFAVMTYSIQAAPLSEGQLRQLADQQDKILNNLYEQRTPPEIGAFNTEEPEDFFKKLRDLIDLIKNGYLAGYEHIIKAYSDFFAEFNSKITAMMKDWVEGANDGKEVKLNAGALHAALTELIAKYTHPESASVLFPKPGDEGASKEEAEKWLQALGLPPQCLKENADGTWCVVIDTGPLWSMTSRLPSSGTVTWDTAKFQAWQTGFNAQEERMKNMLQSLTQKYSNANSYHDNFNKTLSAHLNLFADMLKAMLNV